MYTPELATHVCERLSAGESLRAVCRDESMPSTTTVMKWAAEIPEFAEQYAKARTLLLQHHAEDLVDIADDGTNDWMERADKDGNCIGWQVNGEHINRSRLRVDTRKWVLSKLLPKVYGERSAVEMTGKDGAPLNPADPTILELGRRVAFTLMKADAAAAESQGPE